MNLKYYRVQFLIPLLLIMGGVFDVGIEKLLVPFLSDHNIEYLRMPSNASLILTLLLLYDRVLWKYPLFSRLVKVPNMAGRYEGHITFKWDGQERQKPCAIEIVQSASSVNLRSYFNNPEEEKTCGMSMVEDIKKEADDHYALYVFYLNEGSKKDGKLDCHEGASKLRYLPRTVERPAALVGHYFTNRKTQTRGEMEVTFTSHQRKGRF